MPQSQTAANPRHQEEEKGQTYTRKTNKCTRSTKTSSLFPKRRDQNVKTNEKRGQSAQEDFKTWSAPQYKPQSYRIKNTWTTALERLVA